MTMTYPPRHQPTSQERYRLPIVVPSVSADTTLVLDKMKNRSVETARAMLVVDTSLALDPANFVVFKLLKGAVVVWSWSTLTGTAVGGALTAGVPVEMFPSATAADLRFDDTDLLKLFVDISGTITTPAGRIVLTGEEL